MEDGPTEAEPGAPTATAPPSGDSPRIDHEAEGPERPPTAREIAELVHIESDGRTAATIGPDALGMLAQRLDTPDDLGELTRDDWTILAWFIRRGVGNGLRSDRHCLAFRWLLDRDRIDQILTDAADWWQREGNNRTERLGLVLPSERAERARGRAA